MSFKLVNTDIDLDVQIELPVPLSDALKEHWRRRSHADLINEFTNELSKHFEKVVPEFVDWDIKPPTKSQLAYASLLCSKFGLCLTPDEVNCRGPMAQFLGYHSYVTNKDRRFEDADDFDAD